MWHLGLGCQHKKKHGGIGGSSMKTSLSVITVLIIVIIVYHNHYCYLHCFVISINLINSRLSVSLFLLPVLSLFGLGNWRWPCQTPQQPSFGLMDLGLKGQALGEFFLQPDAGAENYTRRGMKLQGSTVDSDVR